MFDYEDRCCFTEGTANPSCHVKVNDVGCVFMLSFNQNREDIFVSFTDLFVSCCVKPHKMGIFLIS